jgi:type 1 fimbria pilin
MAYVSAQFIVGHCGQSLMVCPGFGNHHAAGAASTPDQTDREKNMKIITHIALVTTLLMPVTLAFAGPSVDVTVTGSIVPGGCTPSLSNAQFDHGRLYARELSAASATLFSDRQRSATLNINCEAATLYALRAVDNRADSVLDDTDNTRFGLGMTGNDEKIGSYRLRVVSDTSTIDGKPAFLTVGNAAGTTWATSEQRTRSLRNNGQLLGLTDASGTDTGPVAVKDAVMMLTSTLTIAPADSLTLDSEIQLQGAATLELVYL